MLEVVFQFIFELRVALRNVLKNDTEWQWPDNESKALNFINDKLTKTPLLIFDPNKTIIFQIDNLIFDLGCCLLQNKQQVAYVSRSLTLIYNTLGTD